MQRPPEDLKMRKESESTTPASLVSAVHVQAQLRGRGRGYARTLLLLFGEGGGQDDAVLDVQVAQLGRHVVARHAFPDDRLHKAWYSRARALLG